MEQQIPLSSSGHWDTHPATTCVPPPWDTCPATTRVPPLRSTRSLQTRRDRWLCTHLTERLWEGRKLVEPPLRTEGRPSKQEKHGAARSEAPASAQGMEQSGDQPPGRAALGRVVLGGPISRAEELMAVTELRTEPLEKVFISCSGW